MTGYSQSLVTGGIVAQGAAAMLPTAFQMQAVARIFHLGAGASTAMKFRVRRWATRGPVD
jgi:hypothetical protein